MYIVYEKRILMLHVVLLNKALCVDTCIHVLDDIRGRPLSARNAGNSSFPKVDCILTLSEIHIWFLLILITHGQTIKLSALTYKFYRLVIANQSNTAKTRRFWLVDCHRNLVVGPSKWIVHTNYFTSIFWSVLGIVLKYLWTSFRYTS